MNTVLSLYLAVGFYRENAIAIESEARYPNGGNVYYVTMQITFHVPEFARKERNFHCDVVHITTVWVPRLVLDKGLLSYKDLVRNIFFMVPRIKSAKIKRCLEQFLKHHSKVGSIFHWQRSGSYA